LLYGMTGQCWEKREKVFGVVGVADINRGREEGKKKGRGHRRLRGRSDVTGGLNIGKELSMQPARREGNLVFYLKKS